MRNVQGFSPKQSVVDFAKSLAGLKSGSEIIGWLNYPGLKPGVIVRPAQRTLPEGHANGVSVQPTACPFSQRRARHPDKK